MDISRLEFSLAKAEYLLSYSTEPGEGGDKRKFWWHMMGFRSPEALREALLAEVSTASLQPQGQDAYGEYYKAVVSMTSPTGLSRQIRTIWVVCPGEDVARFVTAFPEKSRRYIMTRFQLFDSVKLNGAITLSDGGVAPEGTPGTVVEILREGEVYLVEVFGDWVKRDAQGNVVPSSREDPEAFMETLGVATVYPRQLRLVKPASETVGVRVQLLSVVDELSEELLEEVVDFAEFLRQKHRQRSAPSAVR